MLFRGAGRDSVIQPGRAGLRLHAFAVALSLFAAAGAPAVQAGPLDTIFGSPTSLPASAAVEPLVNPPEFRSANGELRVTLEARKTRVKLGKFEINAATYNGVYGGPVLRVRPGDVLHVRLVNKLDQATNIHFHGLSVTPQGRGDNSMKMIMPGETWDYEVPIPANHRPGLYWYHTHAHGFAERQLMAGLSGMLVIEGLQDELAETRPLRERLFALKEFQADPKGDLSRVLKAYNLDIRTINGQLMPRIDIQPGETQLWRLSNQTANTFFRLSLQGSTFRIVGRDSAPLPHPETANELIFGPSQRLDVLVDGPPPGAYRLVAERTLTGPIGDEFPAQNMALMVSAPGAEPAPHLARALGDTEISQPIPESAVTEHRLVAFSSDDATGLFFINHQVFDHERVDVQIPLGSVEEWTIRNASDELHLFHIHQVPFQVVSINGKAVPFNGLVDTVTVPIRAEVKIRLAFTDPAIVGRFMFHCHLLEHEDKGMMAQVEVYDPRTGPLPADGREGHEGSMPGMAMGPAAVADGGHGSH
jgi:FtsP/CotA-like multicopper oxidase with cupredoxin domain